jgi:hypothetical protein
MIIRNVDENGDWVFGKGKNDYKKDQDALEVSLKTRLKSWKFDCFFDEQEGIDYKNYLDRNTQTFLDNDIKRVTLQTDGILRINSFESEIAVDDREYSANMNILTIYGNLEFSFIA